VLSVAGELLDQSLSAISCSILPSQIVEHLNIRHINATLCFTLFEREREPFVVNFQNYLASLFSTVGCAQWRRAFLGDPQQGVALFRVAKKLPRATDKRILSDELVVLKNKNSRANYPEAMRRVRALVEVDGKEREIEFVAMPFISGHFGAVNLWTQPLHRHLVT
jgi:hypothetical protein